MSNDMKYFGIAVQEDGGLTVTKARSGEDAAVELAKREGGERHFAVQAPNAGEARKIAAEQLLVDNKATFEPSAEELAEAAQSGPVGSSELGQRVAAESALRWYGACFAVEQDATTDADGTEHDATYRPVVGEEGYRLVEEAQAEADTLPEGADGTQFVVQASGADEALEVAQGFASEGRIPDGPVFRVQLPRASGPRQSNLGTGEPVVAEVYYITGPGTVHADANCTFARRFTPAEFRPEDPATEVIRRIKEGETFALEGGRKARDWCRFCAVDRGQSASSDAAAASGS